MHIIIQPFNIGGGISSHPMTDSHQTSPVYLYTYSLHTIYHKKSAIHVGNYIIYMDCMGTWKIHPCLFVVSSFLG